MIVSFVNMNMVQVGKLLKLGRMLYILVPGRERGSVVSDEVLLFHHSNRSGV